MHLAFAVPMPVSCSFSVAWYVPGATGPVGAAAPPAPITWSVVPNPEAPMQSDPSVARDAIGVPPLVALPHWVTPMKTLDVGVAAEVVTVTATELPEARPVLGETATVAEAAEAAVAHPNMHKSEDKPATV